MYFVCPVCDRDVNNSCKSILCDCCNLWVHQVDAGLNSSQFNLIGKDSNPWFCSNCINSILPFPFDSSAEGVQLCDEPRPISLPHGNRLNDNIIPLIHSLNKVSFNVDSEDNALLIVTTMNVRTSALRCQVPIVTISPHFILTFLQS